MKLAANLDTGWVYMINADIMFEKSHLLEIGQKVRLSIRKSNVIMLDH